MDVFVEVIILFWDRWLLISFYFIFGIIGFKYSVIGEGGIGVELVLW